MNIRQSGRRVVIEVAQAMFVVAPHRSFLKGETDFLECNAPVLVGAENVNRRPLQRAEKAECLIGVLAPTVVGPIPYGFGFKIGKRPIQDRQVCFAHRPVPRLKERLRARK